jgi:RNA 2',3'-cyclic 3'-phosphodiesterase
MIRAFLAIELSEELRAQIALVQQDLKRRLDREASRGTRISWTQAGSLHLTIKFLGDIDEQLVDPLRLTLDPLLRPSPAIAIPMERFGAFPHPDQPRVLWVGPSEPWGHSEAARQLSALHQTVEGCCCRTLSMEPENKQLNPHLTVARIKEGHSLAGQALAKSGVLERPLSVGSLAVQSVVLMRSELRPSGSIYTRLWTVGLEG